MLLASLAAPVLGAGRTSSSQAGAKVLLRSGCTNRSDLALGLLGLLACTAVSAQPFKLTLAVFQPEVTEAAQRAQSNMTGFVFNSADATMSQSLQRSGPVRG